MRPRGLGATTIAMAVLNLGGFVGIPWTLGVVAMVASVILLARLLGALVSLGITGSVGIGQDF
jgi:hypothetical protein